MSLAALLMLQVQMSAAHEGKLMKESSLQTESGISHPSQQRTCMQCMAYEQGWKEQLSSKPY